MFYILVSHEHRGTKTPSCNNQLDVHAEMSCAKGCVQPVSQFSNVRPVSYLHNKFMFCECNVLAWFIPPFHEMDSRFFFAPATILKRGAMVRCMMYVRLHHQGAAKQNKTKQNKAKNIIMNYTWIVNVCMLHSRRILVLGAGTKCARIRLAKHLSNRDVAPFRCIMCN
jgi:hypothetical protein